MESSWRKMTFGGEVTYEPEISEGDPLTSWASKRCRQGQGRAVWAQDQSGNSYSQSSCPKHKASAASLERHMQGGT